MVDDISELRHQLRTLTERVRVLERTMLTESGGESHRVESKQHLCALTALQSRLEEDSELANGAVMLVGSLTLPDGTPVAWQQSANTAAMLEVDWSELAATFAALGHGMRLELLRHILLGISATADLAQISSLGTTGQLHHHLRQLVASGWVQHSGRGSYEVPASRIVPLLVALAGARR